jgi:hypothetical protein
MEWWWDDNNRSRTEEMYTVFYAAKHEYTLEKDREMEEGLGLSWTSGGNMDGEGNDKDDHNTRRVPTKRRMEIAMKNENEAKELSSGKNYHGATRYGDTI